MNRFNLTFTGETLPGYDPNRVKAAFGDALSVEDAAQLDQLFSGQTVILRRDLERKEAATLYAQLHKAGADVALQKIVQGEPQAERFSAAPAAKPEPAPDPKPVKQARAAVAPANRGMDHEIREAHPGRIDQSWPVPNNPKARKPIPAATEQTKSARESLALTKEKANVLAAEAAAKAAYAAAALQAAKDTARAKAQEDAARLKTALDTARVKAEEDAARDEKARKQAEAAKKKAADEAAAIARIPREEEKKRAAKEAAEAQALKEEAKKLAAEQSARGKVLREAAKKKAAEETARLRTEKEEAMRIASEEAAIARALRVQKKKKADEQSAAAKTLREEATRKAAEEAVAAEALKREALREAALEAARVQTEQAERVRRQAVEEKKKEEALRALLLAQKNKVAAEKAQKKQLAIDLAEEQKHLYADEFVRLREQKAIEKAQREALERAAREKASQDALRMEVLQAEQRRLEAEEEARIQSEKLAQLRAKEAQERAARKAQQRVLQEKSTVLLPERRKQKSVKDSEPNSVVPQNISRSSPSRQPVKTSLNVPTRERRKTGEGAGRSSKQTGAPNFFTLRPFRNSAKISQRAARSQSIKQVASTASLVTFLALTVLTIRFITLPEPAGISGASAIFSNQKSQLLLHADDTLLLHDRAGVKSTAIAFHALGLPQNTAVLAFTTDDKLLLNPVEPGSTASTDNDRVTLASCDIEQSMCQPLQLPAVIEQASAVVIEPRTGALYIADALAGEIFKVSSQGELIAWATATIASQPTVRLHDGLLFMNSAVAPAISVFRPDNQAFGEQLDEVLLLPPAAVDSQQTQIQDFVWSADHWWVTIANPDTGRASVYRFDEQWNYVSRPSLQDGIEPKQLLSWGDKTLILDSQRRDIQRFNARGEPESPFASESLQILIDDHQHSRAINTTLWRFVLGALAVFATLCVCVGLLHKLRYLVYSQRTEKGAEPVEEHAISWIEPAPERTIRIKRVAIAFGLGAAVLLAVVTLLAGSNSILLAAGIVLTGPAIALFLLYSGRPGHIGVVDKKLLLVDHNNLYHLGQGARIFYRNHFIMVDDVAIFTGTAALPVFDSGRQTNALAEIVSAGIKVDRKTVFIKLLQSGHPLARGGLFCVATTVLAAAALLAL